MNRKLLSLVIAGLFVQVAFAQDGSVHGDVTVGAIFSDIDGPGGAKASKYRDLRDGVLTNITVGADTASGYHWAGFAENLGREDQFAQFVGGKYGAFKYRLFLDDIVHNITWDARTPFSGVGTPWLALPQPQPANPDDWNRLTHDKRIRNVGGEVEVALGGNWYVKFDANERKSDGVRALGAPMTSPGGPQVELPIPLDYSTRNVALEGGYSTRAMQFSAMVQLSEFETDNQFAVWRNTFTAGNPNQVSTLNPANDQLRVVLQGSMRQLPMNSTLAARYTHMTLESNLQVPTATTLDGPYRFDGDHTKQTAAVSLTTDWAKGIDSKVYYNWTKLENDSTHITFVGFGSCDRGATTCSNEIFHYDRDVFGIEGSWRFMPGQKLMAGYEYSDLERERIDFDRTEDHRFWAEWKGSFGDFGARAKYQRLERDSNFLEGNDGANANDPFFINRYVARFDASNVDQDLIRGVIDWTPSNMLDTGFEVTWKKNKYGDTVLGRTKEDRKLYTLYASWGQPGKLRVNGFVDFEDVKYDSYHRAINAGSCPASSPNCFDPFTAPTTTAYNWGAVYKDEGWSAGVSADWTVSDALTLNGSLMYERAKGTVDFSVQNNIGGPVNIADYDSYRKHSANLKARYKVSPMVNVTAGYAWEKFSFNDIATDGYQYNLGGSALSGYWANTDYRLNLVYVLASMRF